MQFKADGQEFTYDNLNRLINAKRGFLDSNDSVILSDMAEEYKMDLLGNLTVACRSVRDPDRTLCTMLVPRWRSSC